MFGTLGSLFRFLFGFFFFTFFTIKTLLFSPSFINKFLLFES